MRIGITLWNYGMNWLTGRHPRIAAEEYAIGHKIYAPGPITYKYVYRTMVF